MAKKKTKEEEGKQVKSEVAMWLSMLATAKAAAKPHLDSTADAYRRYLGERAQTANQQLPRSPKTYRFPLFWSAIQTLQPVFYSSRPVPIVEADFAAQDPVANTAAYMLERLAKQLIKLNPVDQAESATRDDLLLADKCTNRVLYDEQPGYDTCKVFVFRTVLDDGMEIWADANGEQVPDGTPILAETDDRGEMEAEDSSPGEERYYYEKETQEGCAKLLPVSIFDILHTPRARNWHEVKEIYFRLALGRKDAEEKFGKELAAKLPYRAPKDRSESRDDVNQDENPVSDGIADVWEVWDRREKEVFYICEGYQGFLRPKDSPTDKVKDPYGLTGFFPCPPFVIGTCPPDSLFPTVPADQLRDILTGVDEAWKRVMKTLRSTRRRGLYNANIPELSQLETDADEGDFVGVANFQKLVGEGGLQNAVQIFPVDQLVSAMNEMIVAVQTFKAFFDELYGISDIMRGASDARETAEAQKIKERYATLRTSWKQRQFQELVRCDIQLLCELAIHQFDDDQFFGMVGARYMPPEHQTNAQAGLALLRTDKWRTIRISIETDSTILINEEAEARAKNEVVSAVMNGIRELGSAQLAPPLVSFMGELVVYAVEGLRDSKTLVEKLKSAIEQAQAGTGEPPPPPPPDYEAQKIQLQQQKLLVDQQLDTQRLNLDTQKAITDAEIQREKLALEAQKIGAEAGIKQMRAELDAQIAQFEATQRQIETQILQQKSMLDEREKWVTEQRLQAEMQLEAQRTAAMLAPKLEPQVAPNIIIEAPKAIKKKYKIKRDALGNSEIEQEEIPE
jgi:hypothetical protein